MLAAGCGWVRYLSLYLSLSLCLSLFLSLFLSVSAVCLCVAVSLLRCLSLCICICLLALPCFPCAARTALGADVIVGVPASLASWSALFGHSITGYSKFYVIESMG